MKVKELLTDESKWTQGKFARKIGGEDCATNSPEAICWCLDGALLFCYLSVESNIYSEVREKVKKEIKGSVWDWNDDKERTFEEVKTLVEKLDI